MKNRKQLDIKGLKIAIVFLLLILASCNNRERELGTLTDGSVIKAIKNNNTWGLAVSSKGAASFRNLNPVSLEIIDTASKTTVYDFGYDEITSENNGFKAIAKIKIGDKYLFELSDVWSIQDNDVRVNRDLIVVKGEEGTGFLSAVKFSFDNPFPRDSVDIFVPGMIYGGTNNIPPKSIGGELVYKEGKGQSWIREDRMPAPLYGFYFHDGSSLTLLDEKPNGNTIKLDSTFNVVIDERILFGAMGSEINADRVVFGYQYPCSEGEISYGGDTHRWKGRYHPAEPGLTQKYELTLRLSEDKNFPEYYSNAWRWAWRKLNPKVNFQNIEQARRSLVDMLGDNVEHKGNRYGITNFVSSVAGDPMNSDRKCVLGFTGKALETAEFLIYGSYDGNTANDKLHYEQGLGIINTFVKLKMDPPVGEGFNIDTGEPALALPRDSCVYLRSFGDDMKALAKTYLFELEKGKDHKDWKAWLTSFADWLIKTQYSSGGFPRAWKPVTGEIAVAAPQSSYNPIPFLTLMSKITGDNIYLEAAIKAGDFCWNNGQSEGIFVGGTIDNPNVIDKEAGTLSLEAYLALYNSTKDKKWLDCAIMAANFSETWIYIWDIPMPLDMPDKNLNWKHGVPTTGVQLIATGHSGADCYMAFDTDEFAQLFKITSDTHFYDVAKILLHNTKGMMALPGRLYDLRGPGWAQESLSFSVRRARGGHRGWLPWVSTSNLNGIYGLKLLDIELYNKMISNP
jgi:hypothetical protein